MVIERDPFIKFHEQGTLDAVTRWISSHDEGIAEWLKNARRAYQPDRADVKEEDRTAVLLLKDSDRRGAARIGLLDVGGATLDDVEYWSIWQDPTASGRGSGVEDEQTQGNGGKTYMFRKFSGPSRILGVRNGMRNCKGFAGPSLSVDRGTPGFMPDVASGREVPINSVGTELHRALAPYGIEPEDLPPEVLATISSRQAFTLVEGEDPADLYRGRIDVDDLITKALRHDQSTLAIQQLRLYAVHNRRPLNEGKPLAFPPIDPFPGMEGPFVSEIPEELPMTNGVPISTTDNGKRPKGRLILQTSRENMYTAYKKLKSRWKISYNTTQYQNIGSKSVSDLAPATPGAYFIYGTVELPALEPAYVDHGRRRPKPGPLMEALDQFIAEKIRELAKQVSERRKRELDDKTLDKVHEENQKLDRFKNKFLPPEGGPNGPEPPPPPPPPPPPVEWGQVPDHIDVQIPIDTIKIGRGVSVRLNQILGATVRDADNKPVRMSFEWHTSDSSVVRFNAGDLAEGRCAGRAQVWASVNVNRGEEIKSQSVAVEVWVVDHVLLTPRQLEIPLGHRHTITAEVTDHEGRRSADVYLEWKHDAEDQLIVRIGPTGVVTGNRAGRTSITAGSSDPNEGGVWARIPVEVEVVPSTDGPGRGKGYPHLLLTGRDLDPATSQIREGDPDSPALWQEASDYIHNVWWLNLQSPEASFAFAQRETSPQLWRTFHGQIVMEMVVQVHMQNEFTKNEKQRPDFWANHLGALNRYRVQFVPQMWQELEEYVVEGGGLE